MLNRFRILSLPAAVALLLACAPAGPAPDAPLSDARFTP